MDAAADLARFVADLKYEDLTPEARAFVKADVLDTIGAAIAGSSAPAIDAVLDLVEDWGGRPQASALVFGNRYPVPQAVLVNAAMAHARELDDTHDGAVLHAGVVVVPVALAVAEHLGNVSGRQFLTAVAAGLEVFCRLGEAGRISPNVLGWALASLLGGFAGAVTAGKLMGFDAQRLHQALGVAYCQAGGNTQVTHDGAMTKRLQPAFAGQFGVMAAQLAARGIAGVEGVFEGRHGFFKVYERGEYDRQALVGDLGQRFSFLDLSFKPYPSCRYTHSSIDAALRLYEQHGVRAEEIEQVVVRTTTSSQESVVHPIEVKRQPRSIVDAQFSIPYTVAVALNRGKVRIADFTIDALGDPAVLGLAAKIDCVADDELDREWNRGITPSIIEVTLKDGRRIVERQNWAKGSPQAPMSDDEMLGKFLDCAAAAASHLEQPQVERLIELIREAEHLPDASQIAWATIARSPGLVGIR